jgi:hypothetical protein
MSSLLVIVVQKLIDIRARNSMLLLGDGVVIEHFYYLLGW